jgi:magnesium chelatase accessory protein
MVKRRATGPGRGHAGAHAARSPSGGAAEDRFAGPTGRALGVSTMSGGPLDWERDGADWPLRAFSRFVDAGGLRWHVQVMGRGPVALLVHGTAAATHSWRDLAPLLGRRFTVVAPDLPGHGFTEPLPASRVSLPGFAHALGDLVQALGLPPALAVGHSAGAAVLARMSLDGRMAPRALVSLNGALLPPRGWAGLFFLPAARLLTWNPFIPQLVAWRAADPRAVARLIDSTGSRLDAQGAALYQRLVRSPQHVAGTLAMMARWDLRPLVADLPRLVPALTLVVGESDGTVSPREASMVQQLLPAARIVSLPGLGHLAHEEAPEPVGDVIVESARAAGVALAPA